MDIIKKILNTKDYSSSFTNEKKEEGKLYSLIGYFWFFFFIPLLVKNNKYCKYHANQGLDLLLFSICGGLFVSLIANFFNLLSLNIIGIIIKIVFSLIIFFFFIFGLVNVINNKAKDLPFIGVFRIIK